jgi:plasmid stabilization system protein ParE
MNFDVWWIPAAENQLAEIWMAATDRNAVTQAADRIDTALAADPLGVGESWPDRYRVLIDMPLVVYYEVSEPDQRVRVLRVVAAGTLN